MEEEGKKGRKGALILEQAVTLEHLGLDSRSSHVRTGQR